MTKYKHLLIDLDKTLWDFDSNSLITLHELFDTYQLKEKGINNFDCFLTYYKAYNHSDDWDEIHQEDCIGLYQELEKRVVVNVVLPGNWKYNWTDN